MKTGLMRVAEVSKDALHHNIRRLGATGAALIAVVKANGYGHGAELVAREALKAGAQIVATADLEEALTLRRAGIPGRLLCWLHGPGADFTAAVNAGIELGIGAIEQLNRAAATAGRARIHLELDTGLSRGGEAPERWNDFFRAAASLEQAGEIEVSGVFSHLANAGEKADTLQAQRFEQGIAGLNAAGINPPLKHMAASAAALTRPALHYNALRVGLAIYGLSPFADKTSKQLGLKPVLTLRSEIVAMRPVPEGAGVSYGFTHICETATTLALVPLGYADGLPRALNGSGAWVTVVGEHRPIVGRIGMDQIIIDIGPLAGRVRLGEPVTLFGDPERGHQPVETWAGLMRTINYEIVAGIGPRVVRVTT